MRGQKERRSDPKSKKKLQMRLKSKKSFQQNLIESTRGGCGKRGDQLRRSGQKTPTKRSHTD